MSRIHAGKIHGVLIAFLAAFSLVASGVVSAEMIVGGQDASVSSNANTYLSMKDKKEKLNGIYVLLSGMPRTLVDGDLSEKDKADIESRARHLHRILEDYRTNSSTHDYAMVLAAIRVDSYTSAPSWCCETFYSKELASDPYLKLLFDKSGEFIDGPNAFVLKQKKVLSWLFKHHSREAGKLIMASALDGDTLSCQAIAPKSITDPGKIVLTEDRSESYSETIVRSCAKADKVFSAWMEASDRAETIDFNLVFKRFETEIVSKAESAVALCEGKSVTLPTHIDDDIVFGVKQTFNWMNSGVTKDDVILRQASLESWVKSAFVREESNRLFQAGEFSAKRTPIAVRLVAEETCGF